MARGDLRCARCRSEDLREEKPSKFDRVPFLRCNACDLSMRQRSKAYYVFLTAAASLLTLMFVAGFMYLSLTSDPIGESRSQKFGLLVMILLVAPGVWWAIGGIRTPSPIVGDDDGEVRSKDSPEG